MKIIYKISEKAVILFFLLVLLTVTAHSQIINRSAQYMNNRQLYNPAAFGTDEATFNTAILYKTQWTQFEGAPRNISLWADQRFTAKRMAVGINFNRYSQAISRYTDFALNYAYLLPLTRKVKLSMGLRAGLSSKKVNPDQLTRVWQEGDPYITGMSESFLTPEIGAGLQVITTKFYAGLAAPDFFTAKSGFAANDENKGFLGRTRNYVAYAGGKIDLSDSYRLLPSAIFYSNPVFKKRADGSLLFEVKDYFWAGVTVSSQKIYAFNAGTYLSSRIRFAYSYEFTNPGSAGVLSSHELSLRFVMDKFLTK
jgi:type IX secretion system PorP/SprF family membrane protein